MDARTAIKLSIDTADMIAMMYLGDMTDAELMKRPCAGCNHTNWQVGHLIASENKFTNMVAPGAAPTLPAGFAERYSPEAATCDDPAKFCTKAELLEVYGVQRAATLAALASMSDTDLDKPTGVEYAPTVGAAISLQGSHWMMHVGQWAVVRRELGRKPLF
jgi:hypothetical protein